MAVTKYIYDGDRVLQETDEAGVTQKEYTWNPRGHGDLLSEFDGTSTKYFEPDGLGSTDALVDQSQTVTDRWRYRAFGEATRTAGVTVNPFTWVGTQGYYDDSQTGLYLLGGGTRYYDPAMAQFLSEDPIGFVGGEVNPYRYVYNRPTVYRDPTGLIGVFYGGSGIVPEKESETPTQTIPYLKSQYNEAANGPARFFRTPSAFTYSRPDVEDAVQFVLNRRKETVGCKVEPIDIFGLSRGSVYSVYLTQRLRDLGIEKIRYVGLIDAVSTGVRGSGLAPLQLANNVQKSYHAVKKPEAEIFHGIDLSTHTVQGGNIRVVHYVFTWDEIPDSLKHGKFSRHQFMGIWTRVRDNLKKDAETDANGQPTNMWKK